jgi:hypothetical protein
MVLAVKFLFAKSCGQELVSIDTTFFLLGFELKAGYVFWYVMLLSLSVLKV